MTDSRNWVTDAEAALTAGTSPHDDVDVVERVPPAVLDAEGVRAVLAPFFASFLWAAAVFRETVTEVPLDPLALLLRVVALGMSVRAGIAIVQLGRRALVWARTSRYGLVLTPEGLLYRSVELGDVAVPREDVLAVLERGDWRERAGRRWAEVYVVLHPRAGRTHLALPPVFAATPGVLAEKLMRWRGPIAGPAEVTFPEPPSLPSKLYDEVAAGARPPGVVVLKHGRAWLLRGPYATVLLGVAVLDGFARLGATSWALAGPLAPLVALACLVVVPLAWTVFTRRMLAPRKGLALVLTPSEMLMRHAGGVLRVGWPTVKKLGVESKATWSLLEGYHGARRLLIERKNAQDIRYDEAFLGVPAEVAQGLADAYRRGLLGAD